RSAWPASIGVDSSGSGTATMVLSLPPAGLPQAPGLHSAGGPTDLRPGERIRRDLHVPGPAPAFPGRGGQVPVPPRGALGPVVERVPGERGPPVPGRRIAPRIRH